MIEISIRTLVDMLDTFPGLMKKNLKGRTAFLLARIARELDKEYNSFNETRMKLVNKYAEKDGNGKVISNNGNTQILPEFIDDFNKEINELMNTTIQLNVTPIKLDDLSEVDFTPLEMFALEPFIIE